MTQELDAKSSFFTLPTSFKVYAREVQYGTGALSRKKKLEKDKKQTDLDITAIENNMRENSIQQATTFEDLEHRYKEQIRNRNNFRRFYYSKNRSNQQYTYELQKTKYIDRLCSREREFLKQDRKNCMIMFVGDRGEGIGSRIKGFLKYGGKWKPKIHSRYCSVCVTNEHNTSQTCMFCYNKLLHPSKIMTKKDGSRFLKNVNGSFYCVNPLCPLSSQARSTQARDRLSALAIGVSGLSTLIFGETLPQFNHKLSGYNADKFETNAANFLNTKQGQAHVRCA